MTGDNFVDESIHWLITIRPKFWFVDIFLRLIYLGGFAFMIWFTYTFCSTIGKNPGTPYE
jgi:hypothetical protein